MNEKKLQEIVLSEYGKRGLEKLEIPSYISENVNKELREYQKEALKYYLAQRELYEDKILQGNHLMFNMATGSGKTLIMAALMLDCYQKGYRNFIFFVNSNAILEKTKANFSNKNSSKYLFSDEILIDAQRVEINIIENINESKKESINIYFTTIQSLFSVLTKERENALSFLDFKEEKIVFLADEAHHLNADTKGKKTKKEQENKENWETVVKKAYEANNENLMLEFSATIPKDKEVQEKYRDKIIYEYALKEFCQNGYSKRIYLLKYTDTSLQSRFLGGIISSLYKELLANKHNISLKPVLLFKSTQIQDSKDNEEAFLAYIEELQTNDIEAFYKSVCSDAEKQKGEILSDSLKFFQNEFGENYALHIIRYIKSSFKKHYVMNVNDGVENHQILLNTLEDSNNVVRVIFAVDKLNEGWDVLNLFDIVRLNNRKVSSTKSTTTSEVQLIGRGARYYPFLESGLEKTLANKRRFDADLGNELAHLERLNYHTLNDVQFINNLHKEMKEQGLPIEEERGQCTLKLTQYAKEMVQKYDMYYAKNNIDRRGTNLFTSQKITENEVKNELDLQEIPLFLKSIKESLIDFKEGNIQAEHYQPKGFDELSYEVFLKALNSLRIDFNTLKAFENVESKREFYEKILGNINVKLHKQQNLNRENQLEIFKYVLQHIKQLTNKKKQEIEVLDFRAHRLDLGEKVIFINKDIKGEDKIKDLPYKWLYFDKVPYDSNLELDFLDFIESKKDKISKRFSEWIVVRNEGFSEFRIYDNRKHKPTYGNGFEPDFIFFGKEKESDKIFALQCFMEVKGTHLAGEDTYIGIDKWKEDFLESINGKELREIVSKNLSSPTLKLVSLPFFRDRNNENFNKEFITFIESQS